MRGSRMYGSLMYKTHIRIMRRIAIAGVRVAATPCLIKVTVARQGQEINKIIRNCNLLH